MEKTPPKDKYLEKKLAEAEEEGKPLLPRISITDLALLGAILLFLIGSGIIWFMYPSMSNYSKFIKSFMAGPSEADMSKDPLMISDEVKQKMNKLGEVDSEMFEEISELDEEYVDPNGQSTLNPQEDIATKLMEKPAPPEEVTQEGVDPAFTIKPSIPTSDPVEVDQENISNYIDPGQSGIKIRETGLQPNLKPAPGSAAQNSVSQQDEVPSQPTEATQNSPKSDN